MFTVTTIAHKTSDSKSPLLMITNREGNRYFFGKVSEGAQRILNENRFRLGKLRSIFLTGVLSSWSDIGGLPGLFLTISDATKNSIDIFTNSISTALYVVSTWRYFVFRKGVEMKLQNADEESIIADSNLIIKPIKTRSSSYDKIMNESSSNKLVRQLEKLVSLMFPTDTSKVNSTDPSSYKTDPSEGDIQTHVKLPQVSELEPVVNQPSLSYLIRFTPMRGKFDPQKARSLGVAPGVKFRNLTQGESVTNEAGELVHSHQVMEKSREFPRVLILDIPNSTYFENTITSEKWFCKDESIGKEDIGLVIHLLGDDVDFESSEYTAFLQKFSGDCKHLISHSKLADNTLVFKTSAINILKLKCLSPSLFNLPNYEGHAPLEGPGNIFKLQSLQKFEIESGKVTYDPSSIVNDSWDSLFEENVAPLQLPNIDKNLVLNSKPVQLSLDSGSLRDKVQVFTLGTGSALPSIHRNVISTLLRIPYIQNGELSYRSLMLDGGENTLGTMLRMFEQSDYNQLKQIMKELSMIYLSHLHADHHLGIISVINKWFEINKDSTKKLFLVLPWQYNNFMHEWYNLESQEKPYIDLSRIVYISCDDFVKDRQPEIKQISLSDFEERFSGHASKSTSRDSLSPKNSDAISELYQTLHISSIKTVRAIHCYWAYSVTFDFALSDSEIFRLSYSGDTRPNPKFVESGIGSDLLIHESSLDNDLIEEAIAKKHSTMIEAVQMARLMKCPKLLLTHFSTRYSNKSNMLLNNTELSHQADKLSKYLVKYGCSPNIFSAASNDILDFDDLTICMAFDMMGVNMSHFSEQETKRREISDIFQNEDESNLDDSKKEKESKRQIAKREAKRNQRLAQFSDYKKKRRVSSEETD